MGEVKANWSEEADEELSDLQKEILETAALNPEMDVPEIADETGASESWTRKTLNQYEDEVEMETSSTSSGGSTLGALIMLPFKLTIWILKVAVWFLLLPFKILGKIFG
ncbi:hypothetical protein [Halobellus inordinatus]|uniref:hypothetical protein n=1 Tax=Halobellus inordinatus TaxID=1126236 RepID=UPI002108B6E0|nr:hypothetical protein [Halobellus inordinatus]